LTDVVQLYADARRCHERGQLAEAEALYHRVLAADPAHADALHHLGTLDFRAGRYEMAEARLRQALAIKPRNIAAHVNLGRILRAMNRPVDASAAFQAALAIDPFVVAALIGLSDAWLAAGRSGEAVDPARKAVAIEPENADAGYALGAALLATGKAAEALEWFERAIALKPDEARAHYNHGVALQALGRVADAVAAYRRAVGLAPDLAEARNNLGMLLTEVGKHAEAMTHLRVAAEQAPQRSAIRNNLGKALMHLGQLDEALASFTRALTLAPDYAEAHANVGATLRALGRFAEAVESTQRALAINPDLADGHANLGIVLRDLGRFDEAYECLRRALELRPASADFQAVLGLSYNDRGLHREAVASCRKAVALGPDSPAVYQKLLAVLLYDTPRDAAERFAEQRRFGRKFGRVEPVGSEASDVRADPDRLLRIGYVSSDLRSGHPIARNMRPVLIHCDRSKFAIYSYAELGKPDATSEEVRALSEAWRPTAGLTDRDIAAMIRRDRIDILVLLAGRFDRNRPLVGAYAAAPICISFHDPATSGVDGVDYLIADRVLVPRDETERFVERVIRLPSFYIHDPFAAPPVGPLPLQASPSVTFGCFNNPAKLSDECLVLWARVLQAVPGSRLLLKFRNWYESATLRARIERIFSEAGVALDRLNIQCADLVGAPHLEIYNQVDIALDTCPFTGSTTTFESLWMGVPVVTLAGPTMVSRWSASILTAVGLPELIAQTPDDYVAVAASLAADRPRLAVLRAGLRDRLAGSPICHGRQRTRQIERIYRAVWRRWCASRGGKSPGNDRLTKQDTVL
jgi:predicted O-linked N-acetylglucosamine transferase (SPINDLY family)